MDEIGDISALDEELAQSDRYINAESDAATDPPQISYRPHNEALSAKSNRGQVDLQFPPVGTWPNMTIGRFTVTDSKTLAQAAKVWISWE